MRVLKLILVLLWGLLLNRKCEKIREKIGNVYARNFIVYSGCLLVALQVPLLILGVMFEGMSSSNVNYFHKEKTFNSRSIYVNTADLGAMGKAYHYFYLKYQLPLNRYELKQVKKMNRMYEFNFEVKGNDLIITDKNDKGKTHNIDVTKVSCNT